MTIKELLRIKVPKDPYEIAEYSEMDDYGCYMTGTFLYGSHTVVVSHNEGKWHLTIRSRTPLGRYIIARIRYTFVPDAVRMANVLPSRDENRNTDIQEVLWEV